MIGEHDLRAFVEERAAHHQSLHGRIQRAMTREDLEAFGARYLQTGMVREGVMGRMAYRLPSSDEIARLNALLTDYRVRLYGPAALEPKRRRVTLPEAVRELLGEETR